MRHLFLPSILIAVFLLLPLPRTAADDETSFFDEDDSYALIMEAVPTAVRPLVPPAMADAVENTPGFLGFKEVVTFKVEKIVEGQLLKQTDARSGVTGFLKKTFAPFSAKAYDKRSSAGQLARIHFDIAVRDPARNFGIFSADDIGKTRWRIYLKRYQNEKTSFIMVKSLQI